MTESINVRNQPAAELAGPVELIHPGGEVEVWCRSLGTWIGGFEAVDVDQNGWRVLRYSDRSELPVRFSSPDIRLAGTSFASKRAGSLSRRP